MAERLALALDGSTAACTAALLTYRTGPGVTATWHVPASRSVDDGRGQARVLLRLIDDMLAEMGGYPADIAAIVVGSGPGTFTGVRIAVATARSLALALRVPVLGVSTLGALAAEAAEAAEAAGATEAAEAAEPREVGEAQPAGGGVIVPVIDARREQVFYGVYEWTHAAGHSPGEGAAHWRRLSDYAVCDRSLLVEVVSGLGVCASAVTVVGAAAALPGDIEAALPGARIQFASVGAHWLVRGQDLLAEPGSAPVGDRLRPYLAVCLQRGQGTEGVPDESCGEAEVGEVGSPESVKPIYVRAPDADVHITKMRDPWAAKG